MVVHLQVILKLTVERLISGEPGQVIVAFKKLELALAYWVGQTARAPLFLVVNARLSIGDEAFNAVPGLCDLVRINHWAKNNY